MEDSSVDVDTDVLVVDCAVDVVDALVVVL